MAAAAARKLQKDIEVVLKKGHEGTEEFAELWDQMASTQGPQKERLGEELKKCINKLQRLRSQMRDWLGSNAVPSNLKDKLEEGRKLIENDMSRFKDFEREFKTKAFSSTGLAKVDELDLEEAEKMNYQDWLNKNIQALKDQLDQFEADAQLLSGKKSLNADEKSRLPKLQKAQDRTRWHIKKLEQLLRAVNNDAVELSDLACVKDSIGLFVESGEDSEMYHDEQLYDNFDLTEFEEKTISAQTIADDTIGVDLAKKADKDKNKKKKWDKKEKGGKKPPPQKPPVPVQKSSSMEEVKEEENEVKVQEDQLISEREEFICKICQTHVVGCRPKLTTCSHLFCGDCISKWFNQHPDQQTWAQRAKLAGPERCVPCPVCKNMLNEQADLFVLSSDTQRGENVLLWRMLSSLKIMCCNNPKLRPDGKCDWVGEYGTYQRHIAVCKNVPLEDADYPPEVSVKEKPMPAVPQPAPAAQAKQVTKAAPPVKEPKIAPKAPVTTPKASAPTVPAQAMASAPPMAPGASVPVPAPATPPLAPLRYEERQSPVPAPQPVPVQAPQAPAPAPQVPAPQVQPQVQPQVRREDGPASQAPTGGGYTGRACGDFEATGPTMVPVRRGDIIEVLETHVTGWSYAKNLSQNGIPPGWVPAWIVEGRPKEEARAEPGPKQLAVREEVRQPPAAPQPRQQPQLQRVQVNREFTSGSDSQMSLSQHDFVEIVERHKSGWTFGRKIQNNNPVSEGWFPDWACNP